MSGASKDQAPDAPTGRTADMIEPKTETFEITPEIAEELLGHNLMNRNVKHRLVKAYARDMSAGAWLVTGTNPIVLDRDGTLLDGQHRLLAVIDAGVPVTMTVVSGIDPAARTVIDTGARRSFADVLAMTGEANAIALAAVVKLAALWDPESGLQERSIQPSHTVLEAFLGDHPELRDAARRISGVKERLRGVRPAAMGLAFWLFEQVDQEDADAFLAMFLSGASLEAGSPLLALRNYADNLTSGRPAERTGIDSRQWVAILVKAWNAWREGKPIERLVWRRGGAKPEPFPIPR